MCLSKLLPVLDIRSLDGELPNTRQVQSKLCSVKIKNTNIRRNTNIQMNNCLSIISWLAHLHVFIGGGQS